MPSQLKGRKAAFLATDGVEQVELTAPWNALKQAPLPGPIALG